VTFRVLTVCTGNVCRSPSAELLLAHELSGLEGVEVSSAGTGALVGDGIPEPGMRLLTAAGIDGTTHHARQLTPALIRESDLILAMAREHRRTIVETVPAATRRTFTVRELARVVEHVGEFVPEGEYADASERMRAAVLYAAGRRGLVPQPADAIDLDVIDPYRRSDETYQLSYSQLEPAVRTVSEYLARAARV
jgi:protein-tyrosine phosphatase